VHFASRMVIWGGKDLTLSWWPSTTEADIEITVTRRPSAQHSAYGLAARTDLKGDMDGAPSHLP
jgi:hypothetical protein